jgi:hypothetical protein
MTYTELGRLLRRRLPELLLAGAAVEVYEGDRVVFREVVDRAFRLEAGGEQAAVALWFRPVGEPEWDPRIGADTYPLERARCFVVDRATDDPEGLSLDGPIGRARIASVTDPRDIQRFEGWSEYRVVWLSPEDEAALDALRC